MKLTNCYQCGEKASFPYTCNYCNGKFCSDHRLPEKHLCPALRRKSNSKPLESDGPKTSRRSTRTSRSSSIKLEPSPPTSSGHIRVAILLVVLVVAVVAAGQLGLTSPSTFESQSSDDGGFVDNGGDVITEGSRTESVQSGRQSTGAASTTTDSSSELEVVEVEQLIHEQVNAARAERGLQSLAYDTDLVEIARYHSEDMAENDYFAHESPSGEGRSDRYERFGYDCRTPAGGNRYYTGAENIAYTYYKERISGGIYHDSPEDVAEGVVKQWLDSPGHRQNILTEEWRNEGIGVYVKEVSEGTRIYVTQNFC